MPAMNDAPRTPAAHTIRSAAMKSPLPVAMPSARASMTISPVHTLTPIASSSSRAAPASFSLPALASR